MSEQGRNFIRDYLDGRYNRTERAERFSISRRTAYKWVKRSKAEGLKGLGKTLSHFRTGRFVPPARSGTFHTSDLRADNAAFEIGGFRLAQLASSQMIP